MGYDNIAYDIDENVAEITMERAPVNAINVELATEVADAYRRAKDDDQVRAVILTSAFEKAFSAGVDMNMSSEQSGYEKREFLETLYFEIHNLQYQMGKPTIAALTGPAVAAGVTLAVTCNCIIASEDAKMAYPEMTVGSLPAMHLVHLPRQIGRHRAFELLFSGEPISTPEAERIGLINRAVPADEVKSEARTLAKTFAKCPPDMMKIGHNAFMRANDSHYRQNIEWLVDTVSLNSEFPSSQEGRDAFAESRSPDW